MHSVYMITDRKGALMYIGCTNDIYRRQAHHLSNADWFANSWMIHHKAYRDRAYAERVETRAIRRYRPPHNKRDNPDYESPLCAPDAKHPQRTKAGMEAAKAAGKRLGPPHLIKHNEKRLAHMRKLDAAGKIRDPLGDAVMRDKELWDALNDGDPKSPIRSLETVRRWRREGYPGLDES